MMLELRSVSKLYAGIPAVDKVSFSARAGEVTGYLGPNGSGEIYDDEDDHWPHRHDLRTRTDGCPLICLTMRVRCLIRRRDRTVDLFGIGSGTGLEWQEPQIRYIAD